MNKAPLKNLTRTLATGGLAAGLLGCALLGCGTTSSTTGSPAGPPATPSATPSATQSAASGIVGRTVAGPACPVVKAGSPCPDRPLRARIAVTRAGSAAPLATVVTDPRGYFRIRLRPGTYTVHPGTLTRSLYPIARPLTVTVTPGRFTALTVTFDSGMR